MKQKHDYSLLVGVGLLVGVLVGSAVLAHRNTRQMRECAISVDHTRLVGTLLTRILSLAQDAETGQRGYLITGEERYLVPYNESLDRLDIELEKLEPLLTNDPQQLEKLSLLKTHLGAKLDELALTITQRRKEGFEAVRQTVLTDRGRAEMVALRDVINGMERTERVRMLDRMKEAQQSYRVALVTGIVTPMMGLISVAGCVYFVGRNLRLRTRAISLIHQEREQLRITLESIGDGVITTNDSAQVTYLNPVAQSLTGWSQEQASGQPLETVFHIVNETTREIVENPALRALREGVVVGLANHTVLIARDGSERAIADSAAPIRSVSRKILGAVLVFRDVSDNRESELALRESEARKTAMLETALDAIITCDHEGRVVEFNPAAERIFQYTREVAIGKDLGALIVPAALREQHRQSMKRHVETGESAILNQRLELPALRADGSEFPAELAITRSEGHGKPVFTAYLRDITERKRLEDHLRQVAADLSEANRRKNEFLATLAHELRNPLAPIRTGLELIKIAADDPAVIAETRNMMERQAQQMVRLIDDLLDVSRITLGKLQLRRCRVDLADVVRSAVEATKPFIHEARHEFSIALPHERVLLDADPNRLAQVFSNLLSNASKYTREGGQIWLSAVIEGEEAVVEVRDTGIGIPLELQSQIFEMFTQIDRPMEKGYAGLGIGLTLVQQLVRLHQGSVSVFSEGVNQGSTFSVRLPVLPGSQSPHETSAEATKQTVDPPTARILVVDDNRAAAEMLNLVLKMMGNDVRVAYDGQEALEVAATFHPQLILMDLGMPKLNGYEAARRIRSESWGQNTVLIALTGWGQEEDKEKTKAAGFDYHLTKPAEPAILQQYVAEASEKNR